MTERLMLSVCYFVLAIRIQSDSVRFITDSSFWKKKVED